MRACSIHQGVPATHECDDCRKLLCPDCVEEGHRLLFCVHCGERALPISADGAVSAPQLARQRKRAQPYSWGEALLYVFRGHGAYVYGSYLGVLAFLSLFGLFPALGLVAGCVMAVIMVVVLLLVPGALYAIVRSTAAGENELPDWPDLANSLGERLAEIFGFLLTLLISCVPMVLFLRLAGCTGPGSMGAHCWLVMALGWFVALALWVPAFGAVSEFHSNWLAFRVDLHLRAMTRLGSDLWIAAALAGGLIVVGQFLSLVLVFAPVIGFLTSAAVGMYGWFTAAHLVGVIYRRHRRVLKEIYGA